MNNLTRSIIEFILEASRKDNKFAAFGKGVAGGGGGKALLATFVYITQFHGDVGDTVPDLHRMIALHALTDHVDWEEVAAFFSSQSTAGSDITAKE